VSGPVSRRALRACDCGCGRKVYTNQLVEVTIESALDMTLRRTATTRRFWVTRACKEAYEEELGMMVLLQQLAEAWTPRRRTRWWLVRFWFNPATPYEDFYRWIRRVGAAKRVMMLQHAIHERNRGFEYARARAIQSAILFAVPQWPRFFQSFLARRFTVRLKRIEETRQKALEAAEARIEEPAEEQPA
jgi:hypothetical protein